MRPPVATLWLQPELNWVSRACLKSAVQHEREVHVYSYGDIKNLPRGVTLKDAADVIPASDFFTFDGIGPENLIGSVAPFADMFRYRMISMGLGVWVDSDVYFLRRLSHWPKYLMSWESPDLSHRFPDRIRKVGNAILGLPAQAPITKSLVEATSRPYKVPPWTLEDVREKALAKLAGKPIHLGAFTYATIGPRAVTYFVEKHDLLNKVQDHSVYCPVGFRETTRFKEPEVSFLASLPSISRTIHLWQSRFMDDVGDDIPKGSFAERLREEALDA